MAGRYANLMIIPDGGGQTRQLRLRLWPLPVVVGVALLGLALLAGAGVLSIRYYQTCQTRALLQLQNEALRGELVLMGRQIERLDQVVQEPVHLANESRLLAGLAPYPDDVARMGVGGVTAADLRRPGAGLPAALERTAEVYKDRMQQLSRQLAFQEESFLEVKHLVEDNRDRLDHIPTVNPVMGPHFISSGFGPRRDPFTGQQARHNGLDLAAERGTPFCAPADGKVGFVGKNGGLGLTIKIDHGNEYLTIFGHANKALVKQGQPVHRGDVIGEVGHSGRSTGDHLHYEIHCKDRPVNPRSFLLSEIPWG
jgi:murein DD-endopeptidase MepM/ murein hydrolase activator NlpD